MKRLAETGATAPTPSNSGIVARGDARHSAITTAATIGTTMSRSTDPVTSYSGIKLKFDGVAASDAKRSNGKTISSATHAAPAVAAPTVARRGAPRASQTQTAIAYSGTSTKRFRSAVLPM